MTHLVRDIMFKADYSTVKILNYVQAYYVFHKAQLKWARKGDNCKALLGQLPRPFLEKLLKELP